MGDHVAGIHCTSHLSIVFDRQRTHLRRDRKPAQAPSCAQSGGEDGELVYLASDRADAKPGSEPRYPMQVLDEVVDDDQAAASSEVVRAA